MNIAPFAARRVDVGVAHARKLDVYLHISRAHIAPRKTPWHQILFFGHDGICANVHCVYPQIVVDSIVPEYS
jgi:hypothetical protein